MDHKGNDSMGTPDYQDALARVERATRYWAAIQAAAARKKSDADAESSLRHIVTCGLYRHFKSKSDNQKLYAVLGVGPDVNASLTPSVMYAALYRPHAGEIVSRALFDPPGTALEDRDGFWGPINRPDDPDHPWVGPRFTLIEPLSFLATAKLVETASAIAFVKEEHGAIAHARSIVNVFARNQAA